MRFFQRLLAARDGSSAAEFALVLPLLVILVLGMIDAGRMMLTWNRAEKAAQMGVRYAAVTDMVASGLATYDFVAAGIPQGSVVPTSSFGKVSCDNASCTCAISPCPTLTRSATAFNNILARMQALDGSIGAANLVIDYENSGLGFSGNPTGAGIAPFITVRLQNMTFQPLVSQIFGGTLTLPAFTSILTMEDGQGTTSN